MSVTQTLVEDATFFNPPVSLTGNIGTTVVDAKGYSGEILLTPDSGTYESYDLDTDSDRYYMGTLWLEGVMYFRV
ncbi:hypothetical protein [Acetobacter fallax]|uniref:Uncharacterized protein n=1 Tax=Acetobacter fallax TaxID=1737473 RepID=A0ABX0KGC2_9PROT|nr:hypothetical protein [Acetobacter fallax]NHO32972.1 hypothetical protein [Acetobacter fallax]NHO36659.1 hypothetical protein [Acetobacter fallax]